MSTTPSLTVDLDELREHLAYRARINAAPLASITWVKGGEVVRVSREHLDWWLFTGLNHVDFGRALIEHGANVTILPPLSTPSPHPI